MDARKRFLSAIYMGALCTPVVVNADELEYELRAGAGYSDNIARAEFFEIDETVGLVGLELDYQHESKGFKADILADVEYRTYADDTFENDSRGAVNIDLIFNIAREFFSWGVESRIGHIIRNPFTAETPQNREIVTNVQTGPDFILSIGSATFIGLTGRYGTSTFSESNANNDKLSGRLFLQRALSRNRSISFNVSADRVEFDDNVLNSSFDRQAAFFGFNSENSRGTILINVGYNELHDNAEVLDGNYIEARVSRSLTESTEFEFSYDQRLTYASEFFGDFQDGGVNFGNSQDVAGIADPLEIKRFQAQLRYGRSSNDLTLSVDSQAQDYVQAVFLNRTMTSVRLGGGRQLGAGWRVTLNASFLRSDFDLTNRIDDDQIFGVGLRFQFTEMLGIALNVSRADRDSNEPLASYTENQGFLTFRFGR